MAGCALVPGACAVVVGGILDVRCSREGATRGQGEQRATVWLVGEMETLVGGWY